MIEIRQTKRVGAVISLISVQKYSSTPAFDILHIRSKSCRPSLEGKETKRMAAEENYNTAINVLTGARFKSFGSTEEMLNHLAWGDRSWIMGEIEMARAIDEILSLLQKIDHRLDRLERGKGFSR